jgi:predicted dehydrogenase
MNRRQFLTTTAAASLAIAARAADAPEKKSRVAIIGHGGRGGFGHGLDTMWQALPAVEIVGVADPDEKSLNGAVKKLGLGKGFTDYRQMLAEVKPELVAIGMRHVDQHRETTLAAISAGVRGIYIEKPFCRSLVEADEIVAACDGGKVKLAVAHRNRWNPVLPTIKKLVADEAIGRLLELRARGKEDARGGSLDLWVLGSHLLNLVNYFAGRPIACSAQVLQDGRLVTKADVQEGAEGIGPLAGNEVHARYEMELGVPAFFDSIANAGDRAAGFGLQLIGTKGIIDLRIDADPLAHLLPGSPFHPVKEPRTWTPISSVGIGQPESPAEVGKEVMRHLVGARDLIAAIREDRQPLCSAHDGLVTVEMISAVFESHRLGGERVPFPLKTRVNPLTLLS